MFRIVRWIPPENGVVKLNVDGSCFGNLGQSKVGGLDKNVMGEWKLWFSCL